MQDDSSFRSGRMAPTDAVPASGDADEFQCPACGGMGWRKYTYADCKPCDGTGVMTEAQAFAYMERFK